MTEPETVPERRFVWPADYYSAPTPPSVLRPAVTYGCGITSALLLVLIFCAGILSSRGGVGYIVDLSVGMSLGEMRGMYAADVTPARKKSLEAEIETMRENLRNERISIITLQPFLETLQSAIYDRKVTEQEARALEENARRVNAKAKS